ncbi:ABC transporter permease subunit [Aquisalimonas asiatica]|uniref:Amino acid/amide ABC transporter membrane protein 2, HAAT family (TC 3.A.1.4.-)/amino acid/amide ABC transporter ATP-binding protein 1, HAAT family (TC 3.A.1.4.-) n=1 Tax=Aquisalimonas asiatica TaxID=406100 RepID=A0A1H8RHX7_9GAMM|nr:branched-chain amino acid ABC transporter ATP-binding protein/permease [Aquisalimonas asiatica]SEO66149.1 amino acid/amide ABC transporter membrane protein 2, HAAT family (TC 3.A.1.4.-)/amino acid/amide ABC transporter ATP-binding protein 1, HAAT family (TC 3.A.1.4.-) [Aquisalimonas asiatica]
MNIQSRIIPVLSAVLFLIILIYPMLTDSQYMLRVFMAFLIYGILAMGLNVLVGMTGLISLGQAGVYALGAYTVAVLGTSFGLGMVPSVMIAMALAALLGVVLAYPTVRVTGVYFAVLTIAFGLIVQAVLVEWRGLTGGNLGLTGIPAADFFGLEFTGNGFFYLVAGFFIVVFLFHHNIIKSRYGRAMLASGQSDVATQCLGINTTMIRVFAFVVAAVLATVAGALYAYLNRYVSPDVFSFSESIKFLLMVVLGGPGTIFGPIVGAGILNYITEFIQGLDVWQNFLYGALLLFTMFVLQRGIVGTVEHYGALWLRNGQEDPAAASRKPKVALDEGLLTRTGKGHFGESLNLEDMTVQFGGLKAVDSVSETIQRGTVHALIGPNGAGKSTLLNLASGFYRSTSGRAILFGEEITNLKSHTLSKRGVARTFQNTELFGEMTALENVLVGLHNQATATFLETLLRLPRHYRDEKRFRETAQQLLDYVDIGAYAETKASNLAFGHQRRLEIARALATNPALLLLDEPAAGLTQSEIGGLVELIRDLNGRGVTIILVEHHVDLIMDVSDKVTVLDHGRVIASGDVETVRNDPAVIEAYFGQSRDEPDAFDLSQGEGEPT